ncbi:MULTISPECIES: PaaI family thioesterase [Nisaea]|uniref:PaaI family thioesterase n=1 Tax=Nisaea TaxID=390876 RepID=UPI00048C83D3|nr:MULTISPECIES: PaaI family thioesterase [Nisaea]
MSRFQTPNPDFAGRVRESFARQAFMEHIGAVLSDVAPGRCVIDLPYREELTQQHGFFHGGIIGTLADNACGYAAFTLAPADASILTVEYKMNIVSPGDGEQLVARADVVRPGRSLVVCRCDVLAVKNGTEKLAATALATMMLMHGREDDRSGN